MTVRELIELNNHTADLIIEIRTEGHIYLLKTLEIGAGVKYSQGTPPAEEIVKQIPINKRDIDNERLGIIFKNIPKAWLELKVYSWKARYAYREGEYALIHGLQEIRINCYPDGYKEEKEKPDTEKNDGQLSLFEN